MDDIVLMVYFDNTLDSVHERRESLTHNGFGIGATFSAKDTGIRKKTKKKTKKGGGGASY